MFLGIEIGGTKLQLGIGPGDGTLAGMWRGTVDVALGGEGIRGQITAAVPELLRQAGIERGAIHGVGVGFGGPVDDATRTVIKSHQIAGWDNFPLADWLAEMLGWPVALGNDADVAGLAEALFGAGKGLSPVFYITIGSGIGGGLIINGEIYRGCGRGAAEIGHVQTDPDRWGEGQTVESIASGWGMAQQAQLRLPYHRHLATFLGQLPEGTAITVPLIAEAAEHGDRIARGVLDDAIEALGTAICHALALLAPRRFVLGGGVSLLGERQWFAPLRRFVEEHVFKPFAGCYDIVPAALGEEVVVHGALALARRRFHPFFQEKKER
jgi:glucokinase